MRMDEVAAESPEMGPVVVWPTLWRRSERAIKPWAVRPAAEQDLTRRFLQPAKGSLGLQCFVPREIDPHGRSGSPILGRTWSLTIGIMLIMRFPVHKGKR
jgi:hypothetical protein